MFCQHCGSPIADQAEAEEHAAEEAAGAAEGVAETVSTAEVEIERIRADKEITLAKIGRGIADKELETVAEIATTEDAVKADILDQAMEPAEAGPVPVVVEETPAGDMPSEEPPPVVEAGPEPVGKGKSNPWW